MPNIGETIDDKSEPKNDEKEEINGSSDKNEEAKNEEPKQKVAEEQK